MVHYVLILFVLFLGSAASATQPFVDTFGLHFENHYETRQCGKNVTRFIRAAREFGDPVEKLSVITIVNKGHSMFGLVNAEKVRGTRYSRPERIHLPAEVEQNWYHHVIAMDDSGFVYDFDFGVAPHIVFINQYLEEMFLDEPECEVPVGGRFCIGRTTKLKDYELSSISAPDALNGKGDRVRHARMAQVIQNWNILVY